MFFVMLNHPNPDVPAVPLIDENTDNIGFYDSEEAAGQAAESSLLGGREGYEIFGLGQGI